MFNRYFFRKILLFYCSISIFSGCCTECCCAKFGEIKRKTKGKPKKIMTNYYKTDAEFLRELNNINAKFNNIFNYVGPKNEENEKKLEEYYDKIEKLLIKDDYIESKKLSIYNDFTDNFEVKNEKCILKWDFNCWFTSLIYCLLSIKKFVLFIKNTKFNKSNDENRYNILKELLELYESNNSLDSKTLNTYRDKLALKILRYDNYLYIRSHIRNKTKISFENCKTWNNPHDLFLYFNKGNLFHCDFDYTYIDLSKMYKSVKDNKYKFYKKDIPFSVDSPSGYGLKEFAFGLLDDEFDCEIINGKNSFYINSFKRFNFDGLINIYYFTNDKKCKSVEDLVKKIDSKNIEKKYEPVSFILFSETLGHTIPLIKCDDEKWRVYDDYTKNYGTVIDIKKQLHNRNYITIKGHEYAIINCFCEVIF